MELFFLELYEICLTLKVEENYPSETAKFVPYHASSTQHYLFFHIRAYRAYRTYRAYRVFRTYRAYRTYRTYRAYHAS